MSITIGVRYIHCNLDPNKPRPIDAYGRLELDASGARLFDDQDPAISVPLNDPVAVTAIRMTVASPGEPGAYSGVVCLSGWVRTNANVLEFYRVDSIRLDIEDDSPRNWGPYIEVRSNR